MIVLLIGALLLLLVLVGPISAGPTTPTVPTGTLVYGSEASDGNNPVKGGECFLTLNSTHDQIQTPFLDPENLSAGEAVATGGPGVFFLKTRKLMSRIAEAAANRLQKLRRIATSPRTTGIFSVTLLLSADVIGHWLQTGNLHITDFQVSGNLGCTENTGPLAADFYGFKLWWRECTLCPNMVLMDCLMFFAGGLYLRSLPYTTIQRLIRQNVDEFDQHLPLLFVLNATLPFLSNLCNDDCDGGLEEMHGIFAAMYLMSSVISNVPRFAPDGFLCLWSLAFIYQVVYLTGGKTAPLECEHILVGMCTVLNYVPFIFADYE